MFDGTHNGYYQPEALRYMAPERFLWENYSFVVRGPSKESDIYAVAMTSFSVCTAFGNHPTT